MTQILYDGAKAIPLHALPPEAWTVHGGENTTKMDELYAAVAFLNRAISIRANDVSSLPWGISRGDTEIWSYDNPEVPAELEPLSDLVELLWRTEESLCLGSEAYWHKEHNRMRVINVRWLDPGSMTPVWGRSGLQHFERRINNENIVLPVEDVVYIWAKGRRETEPRTPPAIAALAAAKVISSTDEFASGFFDRGAVKASVLSLPEQIAESEKEAIKAWWKRIFRGVANAWNAQVIRGAIEVTQIGEGVNELQDSELTKEKREDILTAMGIPYSIVMSSAANFATSRQDDINYYDKTIVPESVIIERQLNDWLFEPMGLQFMFKPQELSVYQEDEEQRAASIKTLVDAGYPLSVASEILGVALPDGMEYADLDVAPEPEPIQLGSFSASSPPVDEQREAEIRTFERWASKRTNPDPDSFRSDILSRTDKLALLEDGDALHAPFPVSGWTDYP